MGETKWTESRSPWHGSASAVQLAPPSTVRSSEPPPAAQPYWASMKSTWSRSAGPAYCLVQWAPPSMVAMIRPSPATQPWPGSVNWTAASAWAPWPAPDPGFVAEAPVGPLAQDAAGAGDVVPDEVGRELAVQLGIDPVPADAADVCAGVADPAAVDPDDVAAQPAAEPATAKTVSAEAAARRTEGRNVWFARALKGISFVTFQKTLYPLARLYRVPSVRSWGLLGFC